MLGRDAAVGNAQGPEPLARALTSRELDVLSRASLGQTNAQVAAEIGTSVHAVKFHLASIFRKLGVRNRTEAAVTYFRDIVPENAQTQKGSEG